MSMYKEDNPPDYRAHPQQAGYGPGPGQMANYPQQPGTHTTVIVNQPMPGSGPAGTKRLWKTDLCGICDDVGICLLGWCCGICLECQVATDMGESALVPCCVPVSLIPLRTKWRTQEGIEGSICDDCITVSCCGPCTLCQLAREVKRKKAGLL